VAVHVMPDGWPKGACHANAEAPSVLSGSACADAAMPTIMGDLLRHLEQKWAVKS
jgi:hypothetical protein